MSAALKVEGSSSVLTLNAKGSNLPAVDTDPASGTAYTFTSNADYKVDVKEHGRFINYKLSETATNAWNVSGLQYVIRKGGAK